MLNKALLLLIVLLAPRLSAAIDIEGRYTKSQAYFYEGETGREVYYESGDATFKKVSKEVYQFKIHSDVSGYSCETEDNEIVTITEKDAHYRHKNGCDISFSFADNWVYVIASDGCDKSCGVHAYGSMSGLYNKEIRSYKAGYNCAKATTNTERVICGDKELSDMDAELNTIYKQLKARLPESEKMRLQYDQRNWLAQRDNKCVGSESVVSCIKQLYWARIESLKKWK